MANIVIPGYYGMVRRFLKRVESGLSEEEKEKLTKQGLEYAPVMDVASGNVHLEKCVLDDGENEGELFLTDDSRIALHRNHLSSSGKEHVEFNLRVRRGYYKCLSCGIMYNVPLKEDDIANIAQFLDNREDFGKKS